MNIRSLNIHHCLHYGIMDVTFTSSTGSNIKMTSMELQETDIEILDGIMTEIDNEKQSSELFCVLC